VQKVADLANEGILVLVEPAVGVRDLPQQADDPCLLALVQVVVKQLRELVQRNEVFRLFVRDINEFGRIFGRHPEMLFDECEHALELAFFEDVI
jgi:hypothetical protein